MCLTDDDARKIMPHLMRTSQTMNLAPLDPEDVVQEALLRAHRHLKKRKQTLGDIEKCEAWSATIVRNAARDMLRKLSRIRTKKSEKEICDSRLLINLTSDLPDAQSALECAELLESIDELLESISNDCIVRTVTLKLAGHSESEIAEQLGTTIRNIRKWLQEARAAFELMRSRNDQLT